MKSEECEVIVVVAVVVAVVVIVAVGVVVIVAVGVVVIVAVNRARGRENVPADLTCARESGAVGPDPSASSP